MTLYFIEFSFRQLERIGANMLSRLLRSYLTILALGILPISSTPVQSAEVGLNFTARVQFIGEGSDPEFGKTYDVRLPPFSTFSGHLVYESNTPSYSISSDTCADCSAYHHKHINGLRVEFEGLTLQADEYIIEVKNDVNVTGFDNSADVIGIRFPDQSNPTPTNFMGKPLLADGTPYDRGSFFLDLVGPGTMLASSQLPPTLDPSLLVPMAGAGTFGDGLPEHYTLDVFFRPTSVSAFTHSTSDHDLDGDVDGRDFLIWQRHVGMNTSNGDANSDLVVDGSDLAMWQAEYGVASSDLTADVAVPEPTVVSLLVGMCLVGLCRR